MRCTCTGCGRVRVCCSCGKCSQCAPVCAKYREKPREKCNACGKLRVVHGVSRRCRACGPFKIKREEEPRAPWAGKGK